MVAGLASLLLVTPSPAAPGDSRFPITSYGAVGDGKTLCTDAIRQAIDAAVKAGGGTVYFPPGAWLSGAIELKSHVTLRLEQGATLLAAPI